MKIGQLYKPQKEYAFCYNQPVLFLFRYETSRLFLKDSESHDYILLYLGKAKWYFDGKVIRFRKIVPDDGLSGIESRRRTSRCRKIGMQNLEKYFEEVK